MLPCDYVIWDGWSVRTWWAEKVRYSLFEPLSWSNAKKEPLLKNLKCIPFRLYPIQPSGFWGPEGEPSRTFLPFRPILFIIHQLGLGRTNLNCRSCRLDESSKRGVPAHTWPERTIWRLNSLSHAARGLGWPVGRLGQIATVEHNGGVPLRPVTRQFWNCQVAMQTHLLCGQFCHLQYQGKSMTGHFLKWTKVLSIWII